MKILELTKDQAMWLRYLDFSANLYAYRPSEKLIIFGKNPLAENVATYEQWKKLGRYVKRGEKGIRINAGTVVFDESQTNGKPINKWQFSSDYLDNFCDYINSKGLSETLLTADEEFDLSLYDHISDAMQHNSSISGRIPDKVRELAALSAAYTVTRRLGLSCSSLDLDLSAVEDLTQYETEILVQVSSMYSDRLIAAGRYVLQNTGPRSRQTVSLRSSKDEEPAVVIEDVEEIAEGPHEEETESQENAEEKTEDPKNPYDAQSVTNDEEPYIQDTAQSISLNEDTQTVEMRAVSEKDFSSLLEEEKMRMLDEVLGYSTDAVDKEKVRKYYLENTDISLSDYTRVIYLNKHHRTNNTDYPCITSFSGKNSGLRINYQSDESIESRGYILIDWSTVSKHIRKLINNNEFIVNDKSDDGEKVTSEPKFYVGIDLNSSSDGVSTHIGEFGKETDSYVFGTYPDYDTASGALSQLRARIYSGEDISDIYENLTFREKEIRRSMSFYLNGKEYVVYDCSQMENFVDYTEPENIDPQLSFIMSNENNKPPVIRVGYQQFNDYINDPERFKADPRKFMFGNGLTRIIESRKLSDTGPLDKKRRKELNEYVEGLAKSYERWTDLYENGGTDPFYSDGVDLDLVRNHIINYKRNIEEKYPEYAEDIPYYKDDIPSKLDHNYYAVKVGDVITVKDVPGGNIADGVYTVKGINYEISGDSIELEALGITVTEPMRNIKGKWKRAADGAVQEQSEEAVQRVVTIKEGTAHRNYIAFIRMFPEFMGRRQNTVSRYSSAAGSELILEWVGDSSFTLAIKYENKSDGPELLLTVDNDRQTVTTFSYSLQATGKYAEYLNSETAENCGNYISEILRSIETLGYDTQKSVDFEDKEEVIAVSIDTDSTDSQPETIGYDLGYGLLGNGITVYNKANTDPQTNDYETVAHIDNVNRIAVRFYAELPDQIKNEIIQTALKENIVEDINLLNTNRILGLLGVESSDNYQVLRTLDDEIPNKTEETAETSKREKNSTEQAKLPFEAGDEIEYLDRSYVVESIDTVKDSVSLLDSSTGWYPMSSIEKLSAVTAYYNAHHARELVETEINSALPENYHIGNDSLGEGTPKEKYRRNIAAIKLLKELEAEGRYADKEEQEVLADYVGWGGLPMAFDAEADSWANEYKELKALLTEEEYTSASGSVLNAHYTSPVIIKAMYKALDSFGFKGGKILEPACGVGNFLGAAPKENSNNYQFTGIELDSISGRIARQLYPRADIQVCGFEKAKLRENSFDAAIGNVPFGNYSVIDRKYNKTNMLIHDYFFAKTLEMVRPGGIVAFITSKGTMDKETDKVRKLISEQAELIGAIRLPETAFKANAGTETVTDIIFLQKRDVPSRQHEKWQGTDFVGIKNDHGYEIKRHKINNYFLENPGMVCGVFAERRSRYNYSLTVKPFEDRSLAESLDKCIDDLAGKIKYREYEPRIQEKAAGPTDTLARTMAAPQGLRNNVLTVIDDTIWANKNGILEEVDLSGLKPRQIEQIKAVIGLSASVRAAVNAQVSNSQGFDSLRKEMNRQYDSYVKRYGALHKLEKAGKVTDILSNDDNFFLCISTEDKKQEGSETVYSKGKMYYERTINPFIEITSCDNIPDAFYTSLNMKGEVDLEYISSLTNNSIEECISALNGIFIFKDPMKAKANDITAGWEPADEYLSGNVKDKLKIAQAYANNDKSYEINVQRLEEVQPEIIPASEIACQLGSSWVPTNVIERFIYENFKISTTVEHNRANATWRISNKNEGDYHEVTRSTYGTADANALRLLEDALCLRETKIYDYYTDEDGKKKAAVNREKTEAAVNKEDAVKDLFKEWVFKDADRAQILEDIYNDVFNSERPRTFDGSHLIFPGMSTDIELRQHQKDAVARVIFGDNALLAHAVGAGKTYEMITSAMEMRRLGIAKKPLFVVPNHLLGQWREDFARLYPSSNVLSASSEDFSKNKRKEFVSRIATGDYDAVIMAYSTFSAIEISPERRADYYQAEIDECMQAMKGEGKKSLSVKDNQARIKTLEKNIQNLEYVKDRDSVVYFEQLGVDAMFVDEAHSYKNLYIPTKLSRVAGIGTSAAKRSEDMMLKIRYMSELNGGDKGVCYATGTPISNAVTEMYVMQKYLQPGYLKKRGHEHFDSWIADFADISTSIELSPTGTGFRQKTRCRAFKNVPELMLQFKRCTDVQTADMLNLPVPKLKNGKYNIIITKPSEQQQEFIRECGERATAVHNKMVQPDEDNMLMITNDGKYAALDMRLIDPKAEDRPDSKINICCGKVLEKYKETVKDKGAQVIFLDTGTPGKSSSEKSRYTDICLYDDIKKKLIAGGIPENEIAYIHDARNDDQKIKLFDNVNNGKVRVLIGSTGKMGTGCNFQTRLCALHHLDVPWKPSDIEQREGRILRQGNIFDEVEIYRYATEKTFDAYSWQVIENKQKAISQVMTDKPMGRSIDDIEGSALNYAEIKSLATGDERIKEQLELSVEVTKLKSKKGQFLQERIAANRRLKNDYPKELLKQKQILADLNADSKQAQEHPRAAESEFKMTLRGKEFNIKKDAGQEVTRIARGMKSEGRIELGSYRGFKIGLEARIMYLEDLYTAGGINTVLTLENSAKYELHLGVGYANLINSIDDTLDVTIPRRIEDNGSKLSAIQNNIKTAEETVRKDFPLEEELREKTERLSRLTAELRIDDDSDNRSAAIGTNEDDIRPTGRGR